jgi:hypothetical protein
MELFFAPMDDIARKETGHPAEATRWTGGR